MYLRKPKVVYLFGLCFSSVAGISSILTKVRAASTGNDGLCGGSTSELSQSSTSVLKVSNHEATVSSRLLDWNDENNLDVVEVLIGMRRVLNRLRRKVLLGLRRVMIIRWRVLEFFLRVRRLGMMQLAMFLTGAWSFP
jgi:hypothetical protein